MVSIRTYVAHGSRITRSVLLGADERTATPARPLPELGIGRDVILERVIVDKNARIGDGVRLVNERTSIRPTGTATTSVAASSWCRRGG